MAKFETYENNGKTKEVKQGFSWTGCFFTWAWALYNKLWLPVIFVFVIYFPFCVFFKITVQALGYRAASNVYEILAVPLCLSFGFWGNAWKRRKLLKKGFTVTKTYSS